MKLRNIQLKSIEARRYVNRNERPKQVRIDHNSTVTLITDVKDIEAQIDFQYTASYGPIGLIKIEGTLQFFGDNIVTLVREWNNNRKMPNDIASGIHTAIMHACVPQAVGIAKDLRLPPPIPLPQVRIGKTQEKASGGLGPEFA